MSIEYNLNYIKSGLEELESYLLASEIYWPIGAAPPVGEKSYPQLTLGNILLARKKAEALATTPEERSQFSRLADELDRVRSKWRVAWGNKAQAEIGARLTLWRNFLEDYRKEPQAHYDRYGYEVNRRVLLELLWSEANEVSRAENDMLNGLDQILRSILKTGDFIWDENLKAAFPRQTYWYLYGYLPAD